MKKISRRLFLLLFLSGSASLYAATHPDPITPQLIPHPTPTDLPEQLPILSLTEHPIYKPTPVPTYDPALQAPTPVPINVVFTDSSTGCHTPVTAPVKPAVIPGLGGVDEVTGRHVMGEVQVFDLHSYRLTVTGLVNHPLQLSYDAIRCMPKITETVTTTCYAFADTATWSGVRISEVLQKAGVQPDAKEVIQKAPDVPRRTVPIEMAMDGHNFLAYEMAGKPLPVLFGFPVRSIFINVAGQYSVKWLTELEVI